MNPSGSLRVLPFLNHISSPKSNAAHRPQPSGSVTLTSIHSSSTSEETPAQKKKRHRGLVIKEILDTERTYVSQLQALSDVCTTVQDHRSFSCIFDP
ncbi:hypothetical protein BLNAU_13892 [Blattamonas nauphoetae]|uniref:DH domain-containing protein n=1 Tax=Blattamonas nauphoetae TaxID=2049346 RepID=A0ABQ9XHH6_9EUKA|nr:hypothetical protein BLNAU_13892 [Blattamonas nauphoetae]